MCHHRSAVRPQELAGDGSWENIYVGATAPRNLDNALDAAGSYVGVPPRRH